MKGRDRIVESGQSLSEKNFCYFSCHLFAMSRHKKRERLKTFSFLYEKKTSR